MYIWYDFVEYKYLNVYLIEFMEKMIFETGYRSWMGLKWRGRKSIFSDGILILRVVLI